MFEQQEQPEKLVMHLICCTLGLAIPFTKSGKMFVTIVGINRISAKSAHQQNTVNFIFYDVIFTVKRKLQEVFESLTKTVEAY